MGLTAGKWREWYPDLIEEDGTLLAPVGGDASGGTYLWQRGCWAQQQRLLAGLSAQRSRRALSISGDPRLLGAARIERRGELDFNRNPVTMVLAGPPGLAVWAACRGPAAWRRTIRRSFSDQPAPTPEAQRFQPAGFFTLELPGEAVSGPTGLRCAGTASI